jgi:hypothetical protein
MYEKMAELKRDPVWWKKLEEEAFWLLSIKQQNSEAKWVHRDAKVRELLINL